MRQATQRDIRQIREFVQIQRLDLHRASAFELREHIFDGSAFFRQGGQIS